MELNNSMMFYVQEIMKLGMYVELIFHGNKINFLSLYVGIPASNPNTDNSFLMQKILNDSKNKNGCINMWRSFSNYDDVVSVLAATFEIIDQNKRDLFRGIEADEKEQTIIKSTTD